MKEIRYDCCAARLMVRGGSQVVLSVATPRGLAGLSRRARHVLSAASERLWSSLSALLPHHHHHVVGVAPADGGRRHGAPYAGRMAARRRASASTSAYASARGFHDAGRPSTPRPAPMQAPTKVAREALQPPCTNDVFAAENFRAARTLGPPGSCRVRAAGADSHRHDRVADGALEDALGAPSRHNLRVH